MKPQPMIVVSDVEASSRFYQRLLGCRSGHGGPEYECLLADGEVILQLHHTGADEHPHLERPGEPRGNGVALWFATDRFDAAVERARDLGAEILEEPHWNPLAGHREVWVRDPDGYVVVLSEVGPGAGAS